jgi:radical SAM protein with 4Fe4S-binding SPASM domain
VQKEALQNLLFSTTINPILKSLISGFDQECPEDGSLLLNSLTGFLGAPVHLCKTCQQISDRAATPFYRLGIRLLRLNKRLVAKQFLQGKYRSSWLKGFGLMMRGFKKYGARIPFTPAGPFEIVWNFTYQCNLRCKHCYENAGSKRRPELSTDEAKQVLDKFSKIAGIGLPALSFSGGEPLARKDFFELAAYAKKKIGYVSLASNGTLITLDNAEKIKETGIDYVEISVDGATSKVHDEFRGIPGAFNRTMEGVKNCVDADIDTCIATVLHRDNVIELDQMIRLAKEFDVRFMHFNYVPTGRAKAYLSLDLTPDQRLHVLQTLGKELIDLYLKAKVKEIKGEKPTIQVDRFFSTCPQYASVTKKLAEEHGQKFMVEAHYAAKKGVKSVANFLGGCGAGRLYCAVEPNGDVKPCVFFPTNKETVLGNMVKDDFEEIWDNNPLLWSVRGREHLEDYIVDGKKVGCSTCSDKYICGGCRARAYSYFNGNTKAPDIGCINNKALWKRMVKGE